MILKIYLLLGHFFYSFLDILENSSCQEFKV